MQIVHRAHRADTKMDILYLRDGDEKKCVLMLDNLRCDLSDGRTLRPWMLVY